MRYPMKPLNLLMFEFRLPSSQPWALRERRGSQLARNGLTTLRVTNLIALGAQNVYMVVGEPMPIKLFHMTKMLYRSLGLTTAI